LLGALTPSEFKRRFLAHVRALSGLDALPDLRERLREFVTFDREVLEAYGLRASDVDFLVASGLPRGASTFLSFAAYSHAQLEELYAQWELPSTLFPLGHNGSGDPLGIELSSHAIVLLKHDDGMRRVFINSSIPRFAESLCLFQELRAAKRLGELLAQLQVFDSDVAAAGSMWPAEVSAETE